MLINLSGGARATGILLKDSYPAWSSPMALNSSTRLAPIARSRALVSSVTASAKAVRRAARRTAGLHSPQRRPAWRRNS